MFNNLFPSLKDDEASSKKEVTPVSEQDFIHSAQELLEKLEKFRIKKLAEHQWRKKISIPIAIIVTPPLGYIDYWLFRNAAIPIGLSLFFLWFLYEWIKKPKKKYAQKYKINILPKIAKLLGNFNYNIKGRITVEKMHPSKILPQHHEYKSEDYFSGIYKNVQIEFSEIHLTVRPHSTKNLEDITVFKGLAVFLNIKSKRFLGHTIIGKNRNKLLEHLIEKPNNLKKVNLVDPEFEKTFDVYTNDQVEARYLIDPQIMERFQNLEQEYEGKGLTAAFYKNNLFILIPSDHNYFEPMDIYTPATDISSLLSMKREIGEVLSLIDQLSLYNPLDLAKEKKQQPEF